MVEVVIVGAEIWLIEDLLFTCCDSSSGVRLAAKSRLGPRKVWHSSFRDSVYRPEGEFAEGTVMPTSDSVSIDYSGSGTFPSAFL